MEEKSLGKSFLILSISQILVKILSAAYVPLLKEAIGNDALGVYNASYNIFIFILAITSMGAQPAVMKVVSELTALGRHGDAYRAMKIGRKYLTIVGIVATLIFIIIAKPLAAIFHWEQSVLSMYFLAPTILFTCVLSAYRGYLQGVEEMKTLAISQVLEQIVNVVLSLVFAFLLINLGTEWGSAGGTIGTAVGAVVAIVFISIMYEKNNFSNVVNENEGRIISDKKIIKRLLKYGIPIILVAAMQNAGNVVDTILVKGRLLSAGFTETESNMKFALIGFYNTLLYVPLAIVTALSASIFPKVITAFTNKNRKELKSQISYSFKLTYLITIPSAVGLSILSEQVYIMLFGESDGHQLLRYGSIVLLFMCITTIQNTILQGVNKLYLVLKTASIGVIVKIFADYFLVGIKEINVLGVMIASLFSFMIPAIINHKKLQKVLKIRIPIIRQGIIPLISSGVMAIIIYLCKMPLMRINNIFEGGRLAITVIAIILVALGGMVYLVIMILLGGIKKKDLDMLSPRLFSLLPKFLRKNM